MPFSSINPTTGELLATYPAHSASEIERRLELASEAFSSYRHTSFEQRCEWMTTAAGLLEAELPDIARVMTLEMGKTFAAAKGEVAKCAMTMRWFAANAQAMLANKNIETSAKESFVRFEPLGPVLAIMPWNFPLWQVTRFLAPALMAGNVALLKHAPNVPQTALLIENLLKRSGYPDGVFTNLFVETNDIDRVIADSRVAAVTLTGSENAGSSVAALAGASLKKCVLELGGSDPFIVLDSAKLDLTVRSAVEARCQNNGQSCIAAKRFIVTESVSDSFIDAFSDAMAKVVMGDPFDPRTDIGPIVSSSQRDKLAAQVDDAREKGAHIYCGGQVPNSRGWYYPATLICDVKPNMRVASEEVFGPVAVIEKVRDINEALQVANSTQYGLGSSCWTSDPDEQEYCIEKLEAGSVFINSIVASSPQMPFGGIKRSGYGRELSELGIKEFCNAKSVWIA